MDLNEEKLFNTVPTDNLIDLNTILDSCVNVNTREKERKTPILMQVIKGDLKMVKLLIDRGADVNAENYKGESALFIPIMFNNLKMVELLIENGADINKTNNEGNTPLFMGIMRYEIVNYLLDNCFSIQLVHLTKCEFLSTPLSKLSINLVLISIK